MAGSYHHVVNERGELRSAVEIGDMLDCTSGDVVETIAEMYWMIQYLAGWDIKRIEMAVKLFNSGPKQHSGLGE